MLPKALHTPASGAAYAEDKTQGAPSLSTMAGFRRVYGAAYGAVFRRFLL